MIVKLLSGHHLEFLSLKEGCRGSSESTRVKMPHCWKSHALAKLCCGCLCFVPLPRSVKGWSCSLAVNFVAQITWLRKLSDTVSIERLHYTNY